MDEADRKGDELENIVREAAEKAQYSFDPKAWSAMEQKLNDADRVPFAWWKVWFPLGVIAIVLLLIFWPGSGPVDQGTGKEVTKEVPGEKNANEPKTTEAVESPASEQVEVEPSLDSKDQAAAVSTQEPGNQERSSDQVVDRVIEETSTADAQLTVQNSVTQREEAPRQTKMLPATNGGGDNQQEAVVTGDDRFLIERAHAPRWNPNPIEFTGKPPGMLRDEYASDTMIHEVPIFEPEQKRTGGAWVFLLSGDLSGTSPSRLDRAGTMFGVLRESYIGSKWSFSFGVAYSIKNYSALGEDYETPWWATRDPEALEQVLANCIVIDLPLNVRRYFDTKKGNSFFVSGGLSSYLMLREDYEYIYNEDKPAWANTWEIKNENNHFFGILNFSIGFERPLTDKLGLNIEPFVKMPISKIGFGQVDLMSFGINLGLKINK